jgi:hypothetical protein
VNTKSGAIFVECNDVLMIGGNCKKSPMNIMLMLLNGKILNINFYSSKCILTSIIQPTIGISSNNKKLYIGLYVCD